MMKRTPTDLSKLPKEIIVDLFNADNGTQFYPESLTFDVPQPLLSQLLHNTELKIMPGLMSKFKGSAKVLYNRVELSSVINHNSTFFNLGEAKYWSELIPEINRRFGINLTSDDYVEELIGKPVFQTSDIRTLKAAPQSLVYIGSLNLEIYADMADGIPLNTVVTDIYLDTIDPTNQYTYA